MINIIREDSQIKYTHTYAVTHYRNSLRLSSTLPSLVLKVQAKARY